jgi:hypothetical protein
MGIHQARHGQLAPALYNFSGTTPFPGGKYFFYPPVLYANGHTRNHIKIRPQEHHVFQQYIKIQNFTLNGLREPLINNPAASNGVCCSHKVVTLRGLILYNRPKGRGIKPPQYE